MPLFPTQRDEATREPLEGLALIAISLCLAVVGGVLLAVPKLAALGIVVCAIAGMIYLAGVIRWAVSGSQFLQLNHLLHQNAEIIRLLKSINAENSFASDQMNSPPRAGSGAPSPTSQVSQRATNAVPEASPDLEAQARAAFANAKQLLDSGEKAQAIKVLEELVRDFPNTQAGRQSQRNLQRVAPHGR